MTTHDTFIELQDGERVSAVLAGPDRSATSIPTGVVIAHGAGNDMHNPLIVAVAQALTASGWVSLRFNFPYREKGRRSPDPHAKLVHTWQCALRTMRRNDRFPVDRTIAAGKSMGGRIAAQMAADNLLEAAGLIFLGYPLHAPGKKDQLRDAPLYRIQLPMLFFAGTRDALCDLDRLNTVLNALKAPHDLEIVDSGNHSFALPRSDGRSPSEVYDQITTRCVRWLQQLH